MDNKGNKSIAELLDIDKPEEWVGEQYDICSEALEKDSKLFSFILNKFLVEAGQIKFLIANKMNDGEEGMSKAIKLFYVLGYMRGRIASEKFGELEKLWGKEDNNGNT